MKNWIYYKDKEPVNLDHSNRILAVEAERGYGIMFDGNHIYVEWRFDSKEERDQVFESIKSKMTNVEPIEWTLNFFNKKLRQHE